MTKLQRSFVLVSLIVIVSAPVFAVEPSPEDGFMTAETLRDEGFQPLFTGSGLDQWNLEPGHRGHWVVRDAVIHYDGNAEQKKRQYQKSQSR